MAVTEGKSEFRVLSGRSVVGGMFSFAILTTALLWIYWKLHTAPFVPLQRAIVEQFPDSAPRVEGGQRKMHKGTPRILRVVLRVGFDPTTNKLQSEQTADRVADIARETMDLTEYDLLEIHLFHPIPEQEIRQVSITRALASASKHS